LRQRQQRVATARYVDARADYGPHELGSVSIEGHPENTESYIWGDRSLINFRCKSCGIITHWEPVESKPGARHGVNLRNFEPALLDSVIIRRFDGADTWKFLD
jgi:hypothetical protein